MIFISIFRLKIALPKYSNLLKQASKIARLTKLPMWLQSRQETILKRSERISALVNLTSFCFTQRLTARRFSSHPRYKDDWLVLFIKQYSSIVNAAFKTNNTCIGLNFVALVTLKELGYFRNFSRKIKRSTYPKEETDNFRPKRQTSARATPPRIAL